MMLIVLSTERSNSATNGPVLFNFWDAAMVLLAIWTVLVAHPGWLLKTQTVKPALEGKITTMGRRASDANYYSADSEKKTPSIEL
jgi:hypothetical protein